MIRKISLLTLVSILIAMALSGCAVNREPIRIGVNSWPPCEVWYIAKDQGYFGNLNVELVRFSAWSDNVSSLYAGKVDITHSTYFNSVFYANKGEPSYLWKPIDYSEGSDGMVIKNQLTGIPDLKNKTIGVEIGTDEHYLLYKALLQNNLSLSDVTLKSIPSYDSHNNFIKNEVDGIFTYEPFLSQAATEGNGKIVFTTKDLPGEMVDTLVISANSYKERSSDFVKIETAWYKALEYIKNYPDKAYAIMAKNEEMSVADFKAFYESFTFYDQKTAKEIMSSKELKTKLQDMANFCEQMNLTTSKADLEALILKE